MSPDDTTNESLNQLLQVVQNDFNIEKDERRKARNKRKAAQRKRKKKR